MVGLGNRCYYFSTNETTWMDAHFKCRQNKSKLVVIRNKPQDHNLRRFLNNFIGKFHLDSSNPYISLLNGKECCLLPNNNDKLVYFSFIYDQPTVNIIYWYYHITSRLAVYVHLLRLLKFFYTSTNRKWDDNFFHAQINGTFRHPRHWQFHN